MKNQTRIIRILIFFNNMIFLHFLLIGAPLICYGDEHWNKRSNLVAITKFNGLEDYYMKLQEQKLEPPPKDHTTAESVESTSNSQRFQRLFQSQEDKSESISEASEEWRATVKKEICESIFNSDFFSSRQEVWMDLDSPTEYKDLKKKNYDIFQEIYPKRIIRRKSKLLMCSSPLHLSHPGEFDRLYVNQLKNITFSVKGKKVETEQFFLCPVKKRSSPREIKAYFVSAPYNVNAAYRRPNAPFIVGRFIFRRDDQKQLVIEALAEEPAKVSDQQIMSAEMKYVEIKKSSPPPSAQDNDPNHNPIRRLTAGEKIRLCATIFSSAEFARRVKYIPAPDFDVKVDLKPREVSFVDPEALEAAPQQFYDEWTLACEPTERKTELMASTYYASRADGFNRIFLYVSSPGRFRYLFPIYYFSNVSVIAI